MAGKEAAGANTCHVLSNQRHYRSPLICWLGVSGHVNKGAGIVADNIAQIWTFGNIRAMTSIGLFTPLFSLSNKDSCHLSVATRLVVLAGW